MLTLFHLYTAVRGWDTMWPRYYLPNFDLSGKTVFDVGAGCGESAYFYFLHGASKVVAIEPNAFGFLEVNAKANDWNIEILPRRFQLDDLLHIECDFVKMDCEGGEAELLKLDTDRFPHPGIIEVHNKEVARKLLCKMTNLRCLGMNAARGYETVYYLGVP